MCPQNTASPAISVIMPCYNSERHIGQSIISVINQTYSNWELLVVDDGSKDGSAHTAESLARFDSRIRVIRLGRNRGVAAARNKGLEIANGDYICFLDSDDLWEPGKLQAQLEFMQSNGCTVSHMDYLRFRDDGSDVRRVRGKPVVAFEDLLKTNHIGNLTAMAKASVTRNIRFENVGHEDYVFWLNVLKRSGPSIRVDVPGVLCKYRVRSDSISAGKLKAAMWQWIIYRSLLKLDVTKSIYFLIHYTLNALRKRSKSKSDN